MNAASVMATGAYRTLLHVLQRSPGQSATGTPVGEWFELGHHWAQVVNAGVDERSSGAGPRATRALALRVRWFPGWESVFRPDYRGRVDGVEYGLKGAAEEPRAGTERTLRLDLETVRP